MIDTLSGTKTLCVTINKRNTLCSMTSENFEIAVFAIVFVPNPQRVSGMDHRSCGVGLQIRIVLSLYKNEGKTCSHKTRC